MVFILSQVSKVKIKREKLIYTISYIIKFCLTLYFFYYTLDHVDDSYKLLTIVQCKTYKTLLKY